MLSNLNGSLIAAETPKVSFDMSPTKEFLNLSGNTQQDSMATPTLVSRKPRESAIPATPTPAAFGFEDESSAHDSPKTPYYMSKGAELVQQTCPPMQIMQSLFPLSGNIEDEPSESVRQRLIMARRKSLQWAPKVGSPLGRAVSYGK